MSQFIIFIRLFSILNLMLPFQCPEFSTFLIFFSHFANFHANSWKIFFQQLIVNFPWSSFRPKTAKERRLQIINKSRWTIQAQFWPCASFILSWMYPHHFFLSSYPWAQTNKFLHRLFPWSLVQLICSIVLYHPSFFHYFLLALLSK